MSPVELDRAEREINRNLSLSETDGTRRVCLHPDRTVTALAEADAIRVECDYCPAAVLSLLRAGVPDLMPYLYAV